MQGKWIKIGVLSVLGIVGFLASFLVTSRSAPPRVAGPAIVEEKPPIDSDVLVLNGMAQASAAQLRPKEEQLGELIREVSAKMKELERKERDLNDREKRLSMASDQIRKQIKDLNDLKVELATAIGPLRETRQKMLRFRTIIAKQEAENIESAAKVWEKMEPAGAARLIVEMWKSGQEKTATKIFRTMSEKSRAPVLEEIREQGLGAELIRRQLSVVRDDGTL
jgi:flagellar motility protein MotE (MotC chaperone)